MEVQAETFSPKHQRQLRSTCSANQLMPAGRAQALKAKRQALRRKINRVADQIYNMKYDTQYELLQLQRLNKMSENIFVRAETLRQQVQKQVTTISETNDKPLMSISIKQLEPIKGENSDRSTQQSKTERYLQPTSENMMGEALQKKEYAVVQMYSSESPKVQNGQRTLSIPIYQKKSFIVQGKEVRKEKQIMPISYLVWFLVGIEIILLLM